MKTWPRLYKKTAKKAIQYWEISVEKVPILNIMSQPDFIPRLVTKFGQVDGKEQETYDPILCGKNIGKANETTPEEQAITKAEAKWLKQKRKGYLEKLEDAEAGVTGIDVEGGYVPMTAKLWEDHKHKIKYPCAVQPKLDGIRATFSGLELFTRTRKRIGTMPHIVEFLKNHGVTQLLDGELYSHEFKHDFEKIVERVKRGELHPDHTSVEYHVYDICSPDLFINRLVEMEKLAAKLGPDSPIKFVETVVVADEASLLRQYERFLDQGYEGAMIRQLESKYVNKRSADLLKLKTFQDAEFKVVGIEEGRGKLMGHVGAFVCEIEDEHGKRTFKAKAEGKQSTLKTYFENPLTWQDKIATIRFQNYSVANKVPRFPVLVRFRESQDF